MHTICSTYMYCMCHVQCTYIAVIPLPPTYTHMLLHRFVNSVAFHPDGNCFAAGTTDNIVKVRLCTAWFRGQACNITRHARKYTNSCTCMKAGGSVTAV